MRRYLISLVKVSSETACALWYARAATPKHLNHQPDIKIATAKKNMPWGSSKGNAGENSRRKRE
jgi:hypothetical protein